jgi:IgGFc binding protein/Secretion system C-terminal sorting domain
MRFQYIVNRLFAVVFVLALKINVCGQYTYPIYGGLFITGAVNIVSFHSESSQSVRITNYNNYDTTISLTANKPLDLMLYKKFFTISVGSRNTILKRTLFALSGKPITITTLNIWGSRTSETKQTGLGPSGSYQSIEKSSCGSQYVLYHPKTCHESYVSSLKQYENYPYCFTVVAFEDQTEVQFDLNFDTDLGRKFTKTLNRGETFQMLIKYPSTSYPYKNDEWKLHIVNGGKITSSNCNKKLAVFSNNFGFGFTTSHNWFQIDKGVYPNAGIEIEQLHPIKSWGYEFVVVSEGKSHLGNTYHLFSFKDNTIWINGKMTIIDKDTVIADTVFYKPLLIQSLKPIAITQYVSGAKNAIAFGAPDDKVYANVLDFASIPPTNALTKEISLPIPTKVGTNQMNRAVVFSPGNNKIEVNGKSYTLTKKFGTIYWGSIQNTKQDVINIKSSTGFNGYFIHTKSSDTFDIYDQRSFAAGVMTLYSGWDSLQSRIRVNKQGAHWYGVDDTGLAVACVGANTNFALEAGLRKLQKITCYLDGKLASKSADFDWKFTDTGKVKITFNYEFGDYGCDSGVQFSVSRWIKIYKNVDRKPFSDTTVCAGDTLRFLSNKDYLSKVKWFSPTTKITCDTCRTLTYIAKPNAKSRYLLTIQKPACNNYYDTFFIQVRDSLKVEVPHDSIYCMGDTLRAFLTGSGGLSNQYIWLYTFNGDTVQLNHKMKESGHWSIMLSDGCTKKPIVKTFNVYVDTTQLKVGTIADSMCKGIKLFDLNTVNASPKGGKWYSEGSILNSVTSVRLDSMSIYPKHVILNYFYQNSNTGCAFNHTDSFWVTDTLKTTLSRIDGICKETKLWDAPKEFKSASAGVWYSPTAGLAIDSMGRITPRNSSAGTFKVNKHYTNSQGCDYQSEGQISIAPAVLSISGTLSTTVGKPPLKVDFQGQNSIAGTTQYKWIFGDAKQSPKDTAWGALVSYTYNDTGRYYPKLIGVVGSCRDTIALNTITVGLLGVKSLGGNLTIQLYPNPTGVGNEVVLSIEGNSKSRNIVVYNSVGSKVSLHRIETGENRIVLKASTSGIYFIEIEGAGNQIKWVVE